MILMFIINSGYGIGEFGKLCIEESLFNFISLYGKIKVEVEVVVFECEILISFRFVIVFGFVLRMCLDLLVNDFVYCVVKDKVVVLFEFYFKCNYIYICDVIRVFFYGLENFEIMKGEVYNVGFLDVNLFKLEFC